MALVCDIKSEPPKSEDIVNDDLEDGEIEDDDEDNAVIPPSNKSDNAVIQPPQPQPASANIKLPPPTDINLYDIKYSSDKSGRLDRAEKRSKHEEKKKTHLTEAEKHVMHLHKLERLEREKREKYRREQGAETLGIVVDDFASNIEKAIASVLKKDNKSEDEKEEDRRQTGGRKRKKKDKDKRKNKQRKIDSPKSEEIDETEILNVRGGSPDRGAQKGDQAMSPRRDDYDSYDSEYSSDEKWEKKKEGHNKWGFKGRNRGREQRKFDTERNRERRFPQVAMKDAKLCIAYLEDKCNKGSDCIYSHEVLLPMKFELCKFYQMECCAKGDKCLYMHSDFPCKYYHTGLPCPDGDDCKFAHGKPLSEACKQILFKHVETAPREILGGYPRMSREEFFNLLTQTQKNLESKFGLDKKKETTSNKSGTIPSLFDINIPVPPELLQNKDGSDKPSKSEKPPRNRPSRWQDAEPADISKALQEQQLKMNLDFKGFYSEHDRDLRVNSNGDVDMRTLALPQLQLSQQQQQQQNRPSESTKDTSRDVDIRNTNFIGHFDVDIRNMRDIETTKKDVDTRQLNIVHGNGEVDVGRPFSSIYDESIDKDEPKLQIVSDSEKTDEECRPESELPSHLPKKQRELFLRIQAQQKENLLETQKETSDTEDNDVNWYSDDDDDRLTIKVDGEESKENKDESNKEEEEQQQESALGIIKPVEVMEKLGDLSKIDISEEVTKLLSSISQSTTEQKELKIPRDPRQAATATMAQTTADSQKSTIADPRRTRISSSDEKKKPEKVSIYEQGSISVTEKTSNKDVDLRGVVFGDTDLRSVTGRPDIDLRQLTLPFKAIQNYTPASEIDASINSHPPITWQVRTVDIPRPDYTGLKLNVQEAHATGDPRLRKIFRLSTEEKESPASPKQSPKAIRVDPRRRKIEENNASGQMTYVQQLNMLQSSAFYQSLTSNQKLLLNQELASRADQSGNNDPVLNGILSSLGLVGPGGVGVPTGNVSAMSILANVNSLAAAPLLAQNPAMLNHGGVLTQNPNIMNQMAQSVLQPGLLGAAPGIPNLPPDFAMNFDPRGGGGGLLGNAPPSFGNMQPSEGHSFNFGDDYYQEGGGNFGGRRDNRGRRGRNNYNRGNARKFRNMNKNNHRGHTPP